MLNLNYQKNSLALYPEFVTFIPNLRRFFEGKDDKRYSLRDWKEIF